MESVIIDATPKGSAILAYGKAPESRFRIAYLVAGITAAVIVIGVVIVALTLRTIPLPAHRLITIVAVPAKMNRALATDAISDLPPSWRNAIRSEKTTPAIFGIALDDKGSPYTFALVFGSVGGQPESRVIHESFRTLLVDATSTGIIRVGTASLLPLAFDLRQADASWVIGGQELRAFIGTADASSTPTAGGDIRGRWINGRGELDLSSKDAGTTADDGSPFFVVLGGDPNGSEIVKSAFTSQGIDIRGIATPLSNVSLSGASSQTIRAGFSSPLTPGEASAVRVAFGETMSRQYNLADATQVEELIAPTSTAGSFQSFSRSSASDSAPEIVQKPNLCDGNLILRLDGVMLSNTLDAVGIPQSLSGDIKAFVMTQVEGKTLVCLGK